MAALKDLYKTVYEELGSDRAFSGGSEAAFTEKLRRETVRHFISQELFRLEFALLLSPEQKDALDFQQEDDKDIPFDELELIVKNNVTAKNHMRALKKCILELDDISTAETKEESEKLHRDELSSGVLKTLRRQAAQVMLLKGADENGEAELFVKQPKEFVRFLLIASDRDSGAFDEVEFGEDLSDLDLDCKEYLRKSRPEPQWKTIREEDARFNKDALKLKKHIRKWEAAAKVAGERTREHYLRKKAQAEKVLANATEARCSAVSDAFREGKISEYYYKQRSEQLRKGDHSSIPEMFEADELKNKARYLKNHDLQDLSKAEGDEICALALKRAQKDKEAYLKKEFLSKRGLAREQRYTISEMPIKKDMFYRGLSADEEFEEIVKDGKVSKISVDPDEIGEDYIGMTMRQVHSPRERERSAEK